MTRGADSKPLKPKVKNLVGRAQNREAPERGWLRRKSADSASECLVSSKSGERGGCGGGERECGNGSVEQSQGQTWRRAGQS